MLKLEPSGMVVYCPETGTAARFNRQETRKLWDIEKFPDDINAPEVVHLEVSARCNLNCSYCYVDKGGGDLPTLYWGRIIRELTHPDLKIFQLTFGGGEPFLREDLFHLAEYAQKRGVSRTATTNGLLLPEHAASELVLFDMIDVSYHGDHGIVERGLSRLAECGVKRGVIWIGKKSYLPGLDKVAGLCSHYEAELLMLAYKTHTEPNEIIQPKELYEIARQLSSSIHVATDGAAVGKCLCNYRFADVDSAGNLLPCSFIREPMGNLLENSFEKIWQKRERYRECPYFDLNNHHCWENHQGK
jgi:MoaA/NifB/PqqE/SkfB family radical SAM enzyme